ncbi:alpha/beta hydrolase-fold protein [Winogradskyella pulchriflava]|uniref:Alpha/beta hydrolase-fold protein n=1 Tax=Winogradskyella pulchriflava TaxID=1110688 RepID=A0ABV6Q855_9FLAO
MKFILYFIIGIIFQQVINAQSDHYLLQVGKTDSIYSEELKEFREVYVELPESYMANSDEKFPVVYVLDGEVFLPTVVNVLNFYSGGFMPEMIVIGIFNKINRTRDLTPSKINTRYGRPFNIENGGAESFLKFIKQELIPHIEEKYRATNYRTLIGHSFGGLFAINTLINEPDLFANYISIDPSLDWDNQKLIKQADSVLKKVKLSNKALYMSLSGQLHMQNKDVTIDNVMQDTSDFTLFARSNIKFSNTVKNSKSNLFYKWQFYPNDLHGTISQSSIKDGLLALFQWYQMENTDAINNPETSIEELLKIIKHREAKLFKHYGYKVPPYPEFLLDMSGHMNMDMQQIEKSKMYFEQAIKYYPKSENAYNSMAEFYISQNDKKNAIINLQKAFEISENVDYKNRINELLD